LPERILETPGSDKVAHFLAYAGLGFLLGAWMWVLRLTSLKHFLMAFVGLMVWAAIDEWLQIPVNRSAEFLDWVADVLGAMSGLLCLRGLRGLASISSKPPPDLATETEVE
jgi:VanZ family protein